MIYLWVFLIGGGLCVIAQLLIDYTKLTPARILVLYVCLGVVLTAAGIYEPLVDLAGCGATTPLTGFGYSLAKGVQKAVDERGLIGAITGRADRYSRRNYSCNSKRSYNRCIIQRKRKVIQ